MEENEKIWLTRALRSIKSASDNIRRSSIVDPEIARLKADIREIMARIARLLVR